MNRKLQDGRYRTEAGSTLRLSRNGGEAKVDFDWSAENACCDCEVDPYPDGDLLVWSCDECGGGSAYLYPETEDHDAQ